MLSTSSVTRICLTLVTCTAISAAADQDRPAVTGISHMCVYASDMKASSDFYGHILGAARGPDLQDPSGMRFYFGPTQFVEVLPLPSSQGLSRMSCVAFTTQDAIALQQYMKSHDVKDVGEVQAASDGSHWFKTKDPEGNEVQFVEPGRPFAMPPNANAVGTSIIHVGYMVHNRAAEDAFYKNVLGFRPYWFGAMHPGSVDWVSQQVPDGHDWLEYMLVGDGSDVPLSKVTAKQLGVLNHFSIGVPNMEQAVTTLYRENRMDPQNKPQMGKDGKWQANLYDPDGTRVELMEFQNSMDPCCSSFTANNPTQ